MYGVKEVKELVSEIQMRMDLRMIWAETSASGTRRTLEPRISFAAAVVYLVTTQVILGIALEAEHAYSRRDRWPEG